MSKFSGMFVALKGKALQEAKKKENPPPKKEPQK